MGHFSIMLKTVGYRTGYTTAEITVTDIFGLTPLQAKLLSYVGMICGPMLTIPWWYEQRQRRLDNEARDDKIEALAKQVKEIKNGGSRSKKRTGNKSRAN